MSGIRLPLRATPFHARTAAANRDNAWVTRNGTTLSAWYEDVDAEALAARLNVVVADISWCWRFLIEGSDAEAFVAKLVTCDPAALAPGMSFKALWLNDGGGVRGVGAVARYGKDSFVLVAAAPDAEWIEMASAAFAVRCRDVSADTGGLALVGPYARATLDAAAMPTDLAPGAFRRTTWRGCELLVSRWGEHGGYEIWCEADDALLVWDLLVRAGSAFGIVPCGIAALDVLDLEAGIARPHLDWRPAHLASDPDPRPATLDLSSLIDAGHDRFNGRAAMLAESSPPARLLAGVELEAAEPAPFTPLFLGETPVGHTLRSIYSPALKRAIALALLDARHASPGTSLSLTLPPSFRTPSLRKVKAQVARLPFLQAPAAAAQSVVETHAKSAT